MFQVFTSILVQVLVLTGQPTPKIGNGGWGDGDITSPTTPTTNTIGNGGWGDGDITPPAPTSPTIGNGGWGDGD